MKLFGSWQRMSQHPFGTLEVVGCTSSMATNTFGDATLTASVIVCNAGSVLSSSMHDDGVLVPFLSLASPQDSLTVSFTGSATAHDRIKSRILTLS